MAISIFKIPKILIGGAVGGWLGAESIQSISMNSHAKKAISDELKRKLRLTSPRKISFLNYFFTYKLDKNKEKIPATLYVRRGKNTQFLRMTTQEMNSSGATPIEYEDFLNQSLASKVNNISAIIDKVNL